MLVLIQGFLQIFLDLMVIDYRFGFFRPASESPAGTARLTIFYNGTVAVFDVPHDKVLGF